MAATRFKLKLPPRFVICVKLAWLWLTFMTPQSRYCPRSDHCAARRGQRPRYRKGKAKSNFLGYYGYPATVCTSVNEEIVHGIPGQRVLQDGDLA